MRAEPVLGVSMKTSTKQPTRTGAQVSSMIPLRNGDVQALQVTVVEEGVVLAVFDEGTDGQPLIQVVLDRAEQASLVHALLGPGTAPPTSVADVAHPESAVPAGSCRTRGTA